MSARLAAWAIGAAMLGSTAGLADVIHLRSGAEVRTDSWWLDGDRLVYEVDSGTVAIPRSEVERIVPARGPSDSSTRPTAPAPPADRPPTHPLLAEGTVALERRDYEAASAAFLRALRENPDLHDARLGYAVSEMALGRDMLAMNAVLDGLDRAPAIPEFHEVLGDLYDRDERGHEAVACWREAFRLAPSDRLREKILRGERERTAGSDDRSSASAHFTVRLDRGVEPELTAEIVDFLENRHEAITRALEHAPLQPIVVVLYPEREFRTVTQAPENVAGLYDGKIRVPLAGVQALDPRMHALLSHELTHAIVQSKTRGNCPRWLHEGLAQRFEGRPAPPSERAEFASLLRRYGAPDWDDEPLSYPAAWSFVEYLEREGGLEGLVAVLDALATGTEADRALEDVFGSGTAALTRRWLAGTAGPSEDAR